MKKMILIISIISLLMMGCSEDAPTTPAAIDYTEFLAGFPPCVSDCGITSPKSLCTFLDNPDYADSPCMDDCTDVLGDDD